MEEQETSIDKDILRRAQPDKVNLKIGDEVILLDSTEIAEFEIKPQSIAMKRTKINEDLKAFYFSLRNKHRMLYI